MEKKRNVQTITVVALVMALIFMSVGFAVFAQELNIEGTANIGASNWEVHFKSDSYKESTGSVVASSKTVANTAMSYTVNLEQPGDFYEFTIDVENTGTFDASLSAITLSTLSAAQSKFLKYTLSYDGTEYSSTNSSLTGIQLDKENGVAHVKVRVEYIEPSESSDLPSEAQSITLTAALSYVQKAQ